MGSVAHRAISLPQGRASRLLRPHRRALFALAVTVSPPGVRMVSTAPDRNTCATSRSASRLVAF